MYLQQFSFTISNLSSKQKLGERTRTFKRKPNFKFLTAKGKLMKIKVIIVTNILNVRF